jgi:hypothetical protein
MAYSQANPPLAEPLSVEREFDQAVTALILHQIAIDIAEDRTKLVGPAGGQIDAQHSRIVVTKQQNPTRFILYSQEAPQMLTEVGRVGGAQKNAPTVTPPLLYEGRGEREGGCQFYQVGRRGLYFGRQAAAVQAAVIEA